MRKFELLRDLPNLKAGAVFTPTHIPTIYQDDKDLWGYHASIVENNPEWFKEVVENKQSIYELHKELYPSEDFSERAIWFRLRGLFCRDTIANLEITYDKAYAELLEIKKQRAVKEEPSIAQELLHLQDEMDNLRHFHAILKAEAYPFLSDEVKKKIEDRMEKMKEKP